MSALHRPAADPARDPSSAPGVPLGALLAITIVLTLAACLLLGSALVALKHPPGGVVAGLDDQNQSAKTATYLIAVLVIAPLALVLVPRLVERIAAAGRRDVLAPAGCGLGMSLAAVLVVVRLAPHIGIHDGLKALLAGLALWWLAAAWVLSVAVSGRSAPPLRWLGERPGVALTAGGLLALAAVLCLTDVRGLDPLALGLAAVIVVAALATRGRARRRPMPRPAGRTIDGLAVLVLLLAVPNVVIFHTGGIPNTFYPPGIVQFHQDWLLGPANQLLGGGALLVNVPVSQYGVGFIYFLAAWFHVAPIGYGTYGLLDGLVTALFYSCAYGLLRAAGVARWLALCALGLAVVAFVYHLYYSIGELPQQGPLRFGLPMAVIVAQTAALRWPRRDRLLRVLALLALAAAAVWSLEMLAYTLATYLTVLAFRGWLAPGPLRPALARELGLALCACVGAHAVLALWTLLGTGQLPDWGQYLTYVDALVLGHQAAGQISYGFAAWSPGLAVGAASLASALAVVLVIRRAPDAVRRDPVRFLALAGLSTYALVLFSYTDNRSSTYLLPYVSLPLLLAGTLWLSLLLSAPVALSAPARRVVLGLALSVSGVMIAAAWPSIGPLFSQSALAHAYPGGGLRGALTRLWHPPPIDPRSLGGVALLDRYVPGRRALVLLPDLPDLGTEILMRGRRSNALFMGDPKADGFIDPTEWTGKLSAELQTLRPGARLLTDPAGLLIARALRGRAGERRPGASDRPIQPADRVDPAASGQSLHADTRGAERRRSHDRRAGRRAARRRRRLAGLSGAQALAARTTLWAAMARNPRRALGHPLGPRREAQGAGRREVGHEAELLAHQHAGAGRPQAAQHLGLGDQPLLPGVLRDPRHQPAPVGVSGIVVPHEDPARGPCDPHHLGQSLADIGRVGDVVHDGDAHHEVKAGVGKRQRGTGPVHPAHVARIAGQDREHPL